MSKTMSSGLENASLHCSGQCIWSLSADTSLMRPASIRFVVILKYFSHESSVSRYVFFYTYPLKLTSVGQVKNITFEILIQ